MRMYAVDVVCTVMCGPWGPVAIVVAGVGWDAIGELRIVVLVLVAGGDAGVVVSADDCVDTADEGPWAKAGILEADEDADAGISSRGCKVVGGVEISGAAGAGGGGIENALGGLEEAPASAGIDESGCSADDVGKSPTVGGGPPNQCSGSPACSPGSGKLAVLRRPMLPSLDGVLSTEGHRVSLSCSFRSTRSRSDSVSFRSCTSVARSGLDGGVGAELLRTNGGDGEGGRG